MCEREIVSLCVLKAGLHCAGAKQPVWLIRVRVLLISAITGTPAWQGGCDGSRTKIGGQCLESSTLYYVIGSLSFLVAVLLLVFGIKMQREAHSKSQSSSEWTIQVPRASQKFSRFEPSWISRPLCNTVDAER